MSPAADLASGLRRLPGTALVISPLIALMKDQVDHLVRTGIPATCINSTLTAAEQAERLRQLAQAKYRLVYVAPERLRSLAFLDALRGRPRSLLAVDESHCISEWGHDFRPDYLNIARFREALGRPQKELHTLAQKRANVAGAFAVRGEVRGRHVLLVDDLYDSGATLEEITRLLLRQGAGQVNVLTLTRTIHADA